MPPDLLFILGEVRQLSEKYKTGGPDAFTAFRDLIALLLNLTITPSYAMARLTVGPRGTDIQVLGGRSGPGDPLPLNDDRYLRLTMTLSLVQAEGHQFLKAMDSSYQYQLDEGGDRWVFRYDYRRVPPDPYPAAHLQIRARPHEEFLPADRQFERIHFPSGRVSVEAVIRLLADQFGVPCNRSPELWRPILAESEKIFYEIAHLPLSGPDR